MATTTSLADDPNPGIPTGLTATPGNGEVTLGWTDPEYCGSGNLCSATVHQHYLEYKLTRDADDAWGNGAVVAGSPHATMRPVPGLANGMQYDFRLAVQLTGDSDTTGAAIIDNNRAGALAGYVTGATAILNVAAADSDVAIDLQGATTADSQTIGGLVGFQSGGSITASFATGDADGGAGASDQVGKLIGALTGGRSPATSPGYASYGFGATAGAESAVFSVDGAAKPAGVTGAADLTADNAGSEWSSTVWDFGDMQAPALKYISSYTFDDNDTPTDYSDDSHSYSCVAADFLPIVVDCVNGTLLPGQR